MYHYIDGQPGIALSPMASSSLILSSRTSSEYIMVLLNGLKDLRGLKGLNGLKGLTGLKG